jgi:glycosyltransferase involved in cell wall biosynthesis
VRISVVTVCRNSAGSIGRTLDSFFRQDHPDKELVVVDGASSDGTLEVVRAFAGRSLVLISEPDRGVYDAMNKGLAVFTGDAVGFLNSDDRFHDPGALSAVAEGLERAEVVHGDLDVLGGEGSERVIRRWRSTPWRKGGFRRGWMPAHPTFYCRRGVVEEVGLFDERYPIAADYDFMLRTLEVAGVTAAQLPRVLVDMASGGLSSRGWTQRIRHNLEALESRRRWLGAGLVDYALFAKPLGKVSQFVGA